MTSSKRIGKFSVVAKLGSGAGGEVILVEDPQTKNRFAMKSIVSEGNSKSIRSEMEVLLNRKLISPFLLKYHYFTLESNYTRILMEYCENSDLGQWVDKQKGFLKEDKVINLFVQIIEGLSVLHENDIVHRDIKPGNVLMNRYDEAKLSDFGIAKSLSQSVTATNTSTPSGTLGYIPAEVINGENHSIASDVFALGCTVYYIMTKRVAFAGPTNYATIPKILAGKFDPIVEGGYSDGLRKLVYSMLNPDPKARPTLADLKAHRLLRDARRVVLTTPRHGVPEPPSTMDARGGVGEEENNAEAVVDADVAEIIRYAAVGNPARSEPPPVTSLQEFRVFFARNVADRMPFYAETALFLRSQKNASLVPRGSNEAYPVSPSLPVGSHRVVPCKFFLRGLCRKGLNCPFSHNPALAPDPRTAGSTRPASSGGAYGSSSSSSAFPKPRGPLHLRGPQPPTSSTTAALVPHAIRSTKDADYLDYWAIFCIKRNVNLAYQFVDLLSFVAESVNPEKPLFFKKNPKICVVPSLAFEEQDIRYWLGKDEDFRNMQFLFFIMEEDDNYAFINAKTFSFENGLPSQCCKRGTIEYDPADRDAKVDVYRCIWLQIKKKIQEA